MDFRSPADSHRHDRSRPQNGHFFAVNPVAALVWAAVINGIVAVPVMVMLMLMSANRKIMGRLEIPRTLRLLGWGATGIMAAATVAFVVTTIQG